MDLNEVQINEIQVTRMPNNLHIQLKILTLMRNSLIMVVPSYSQTLCNSALSAIPLSAQSPEGFQLLLLNSEALWQSL